MIFPLGGLGDPHPVDCRSACETAGEEMFGPGSCLIISTWAEECSST